MATTLELLEQAKTALYAAALVCGKGDGLSYRDRKDAHELVLQAIADIGEYQAQAEEQPLARLADIAGAVIEKVGSHHYSWSVGEYNHNRVYPTKAEAVMALNTYLADSVR